MKRQRSILLAILTFLLSPLAESQTQWVRVEKGLTSYPVTCLSVSGSCIFAGTGGNGILRSTDDGTSWSPVDSGLSDSPDSGQSYVYALAASGGSLFAGTAVGVWRSSDNGNSWAMSASLPTVYGLAGSGRYLFAGTYDGGVYLSADSGSSWKAVNAGLQSEMVRVLSICDTTLFIGTEYGAYRSTDYGTSWQQITGGPIYAVDIMGPYAIIGADLFAGSTYGEVFHSTDNGISWNQVGVTGTGVAALVVSGVNLIVGTYSGGVLLSSNGGTSWNQVNTGLTNSSVRCLALAGPNLFAGTGGGGVWRRTLLNVLSVNPETKDGPVVFTLYQNYPNPFNPSTTIKYELPKASLVTLTVFDILGREVSVLVNERRDAGVYEVKFDGQNLASGVYSYRLQAGDYVATKRLLLLK